MSSHREPPHAPLRVTDDLSGKSLDAVVRALFALTWGKARSCIETGKVQLDGQTVTNATQRVRAGSEVALRMRAPRPRPGDLAESRVVYVDTHVIVVDKPAGISTIPYGDEEDPDTLDAKVRAILAKGKHAAGRDQGARPALGIVHRLDKETSGLIVFTRTWLAKKSLTEQFRAHSIGRRYLAIVHGDMFPGSRSSPTPRTLRSHLVSDRGDGLRGSTQRPGQRERGATAPQLAITHVEPVERLRGATLVACRLETGRTHQIRIHLSEAGHPLVGERVYIRNYARDIVPAPRLMLHAAELGFVHPATQKPLSFTLPLPPDMAEILEGLRAPDGSSTR
ncbi:pseudouridine synthase [Pendulispora albinea]|uniref:RluA family pseudouridine synthase n=1 Tax=Pendulispora albinea TaxID=2741071 RepID=A0ABZ2LPH4_9BACT